MDLGHFFEEPIVFLEEESIEANLVSVTLLKLYNTVDELGLIDDLLRVDTPPSHLNMVHQLAAFPCFKNQLKNLTFVP